VALALADVSSSDSTVVGKRPGELLRLQSSDPCSRYAYLKFEQVLSSNLGNAGPDQDADEGLVFLTRNLGGDAEGAFGREVELVINAVGGYRPAEASMNGFTGKYGSINIAAGGQVQLKFSVRDHRTKSPVTLKTASLTFFDLDQGHAGSCQKSVLAEGFTDVHLTTTTEVVRHVLPGGKTVFKASTYGTVDDNPSDPEFMTQRQKDRAVSLLFSNFQESTITLGSTKGSAPSFFLFVARPSLLCAVTVQEDFQAPVAMPKRHATSPGTSGHRLARLVVGRRQTPLACPGGVDGFYFVEWKVANGDRVASGDSVGTLRSNAGVRTDLRAPRDGIIHFLQPLQRGDSIHQRVPDCRLGVLNNMLLPLRAADGDLAVFPPAPQGFTFERWHVKQGDYVRKGGPVAAVSKHGVKTVLPSPAGGIVKFAQHLEQGDDIDKVMIGNDIAIIHPCLEPLKVDRSFQMAIKSRPLSEFVEWKVSKADVVKEGQTIALIRLEASRDRILSEVRSPGTGIVESMQPLWPGDRVDERLPDMTLATIGSKWPALDVDKKSGDVGLTCNPGMYFVRFRRRKGDRVQMHEPLAELSFTNPVGRRLASDDVLLAPMDGYIKDMQPLRPGDKVGARVMDLPPVIISIGVPKLGPPWWLWLLMGLLMLHCGVLILS